MATIMNLNDPLNLRELLSSVTLFMRKHHPKNEPKNPTHFIDMLFNGLQECDVSEYSALTSRGNKPYSPPITTDIQKLLSGHLSPERLKVFTTLLSAGAYDDLFIRNLAPFVDVFSNYEQDVLFEELYNKIKPRFFDHAAVERLEASYAKKEYVVFLLDLIKHAFQCPEYIPAIYGRRIYEQALTFDYDDPIRFVLMQEAADNGSEEACLEYANFLAKRDNYDRELDEEEREKFSTAMHYFLKAGNYDPAMWNIAFFLQKDYMSPDDIKEISEALRIQHRLGFLNAELLKDQLYIIKPGENAANPEAVLLAYKIYFYLAFQDVSFSKAFNSMANMLLSDSVTVTATSHFTTADLANHYRELSLRGQDIFGLTNVGSQLLKQITNGRFDFNNKKALQHIAEVIKVSADAGVGRGLYNQAVLEELSGYYNLTTGQIKALYQQAVSTNTLTDYYLADTFYRLGKLETNDPEKCEQQYKEAALLGHAEAAYEFALLVYQKIISGKEKDKDLLLASDLLRSLYQKLQDEEKGRLLLAKYYQLFSFEGY